VRRLLLALLVAAAPAAADAGDVPIELPLYGRYNIENFLAAAAAPNLHPGAVEAGGIRIGLFTGGNPSDTAGRAANPRVTPDAMSAEERKAALEYIAEEPWWIRPVLRRAMLDPGGFQTASVIRKAITNGDCDAVSMARPLIANNDLVKQFAAGRDQAERPCTYCNKCLVHVVQDPLGCYEESRFSSRDAMLEDVMSVFQPPAFS